MLCRCVCRKGTPYALKLAELRQQGVVAPPQPVCSASGTAPHLVKCMVLNISHVGKRLRESDLDYPLVMRHRWKDNDEHIVNLRGGNWGNGAKFVQL